ncbi:MAG: helicase-related protein, partial [Eubacteriales bacterium]|nr:helicase-related protein [Eubacteriales bacterium]
HGDKTQAARQAALSAFRQGKLKVLIATDIAARGIDIAGLSHVINYDLPNEPESYIHRIGRTGRAGMDGDAISFCSIDEVKYLREIEKLIGRSIPRRECDWPMTIFTETPKAPRIGRTPEQIAEARRRGQFSSRKPAAFASQGIQKHSGGSSNAKHTGLPKVAR